MLIVSLIKIILGIIALFVFISLIWRFLSNRYSLPCPTWLGWLVEMDNPFTKTNRAATIIEHLDLKAGMTVVDIGCGPGRVTIPVAHAIGPQGEVVAMDIQAGMLERTKEKAQAGNLANITYLHAGVGENKLGKEKFDRALLVTVLGEIPNKNVAFKEIYDSLKSGGILSVTEIIFDPHFQRRKTVLKLAQEVGFKEKEFFGNRIAYTLNLEKPNL